jgi:hypothetical protein
MLKVIFFFFLKFYKIHLSSMVSNGTTIVINTCKCLSRGNTCDPGSQWFKF